MRLLRLSTTSRGRTSAAAISASLGLALRAMPSTSNSLSSAGALRAQ